jgi:hypothetical protein
MTPGDPIANFQLPIAKFAGSAFRAASQSAIGNRKLKLFIVPAPTFVPFDPEKIFLYCVSTPERRWSDDKF